MGTVPPENTVATLVHAGVPVKGFSQSADLEDLFVSLTGEGFDVSG
jgi:ABC-2 type transport system ATP-binding protein